MRCDIIIVVGAIIFTLIVVELITTVCIMLYTVRVCPEGVCIY